MLNILIFSTYESKISFLNYLVFYYSAIVRKDVCQKIIHHQLIILGSGPAGYSAAVYAKRAPI